MPRPFPEDWASSMPLLEPGPGNVQKEVRDSRNRGQVRSHEIGDGWEGKKPDRLTLEATGWEGIHEQKIK